MPEMATAKEFTDLMEKHDLRNNRGAELVAKWLYLKVGTVQMMYKNGILRAYFDYVKLKLNHMARNRRALKRKQAAI